MPGMRSLLGVLAVFGAMTLSFSADAKMSRAGRAAVTFIAVGPGGMKIEGKSGELRVAEEGATLIISVPLSPLDSGIELRDKHMKEKYLEVDKYPTAELRVPRASLRIPADGATSTGDVEGQMKLHGQTKPVTFHYEAKKAGPAFVVKGSVRVNMREFGITVPSYMGVTVKPDVNVHVAFGATDG